jgi:hypothetical protein
MAKRMGQVVCLFTLLFAGCVGKQELPVDPLFANGKPPESKAQTGAPIAPPFSEPAPPANKTLAVQR